MVTMMHHISWGIHFTKIALGFDDTDANKTTTDLTDICPKTITSPDNTPQISHEMKGLMIEKNVASTDS